MNDDSDENDTENVFEVSQPNINEDSQLTVLVEKAVEFAQHQTVIKTAVGTKEVVYNSFKNVIP